jgi:hypothetical protein
MLARSERGTEEELLTVLPDRIQAHGERLWKASVSRIHVSSFHLVTPQITVVYPSIDQHTAEKLRQSHCTMCSCSSHRLCCSQSHQPCQHAVRGSYLRG